jgi:ABC-type branched-subunit amino acid transport system ATPase component
MEAIIRPAGTSCRTRLRDLLDPDHVHRRRHGQLSRARHRRDRPRDPAYANRRRLEIARALVSEPRLLLLDEPTAGMNPHETAGIVTLIQAIRAMGITVFLIEHDMKVIMNASDRIIVLDHGEKIAEGRPEEIRVDEDVIQA